jgi:hypothetical protein
VDIVEKQLNFESIISETDPAVLREWMVGRVDCSLDEWLWIMFILYPEEDDQLPF